MAKQSSLFDDDCAPETQKNAPAALVEGRVVPVLLPMSLEGSFDYVAADGLDVSPGQLVHVPLGSTKRVGVVLKAPVGNTKSGTRSKLKSIEGVLDLPPLSDATLSFIAFVSAYSLARPGLVLRMVLSSREALEGSPLESIVLAGDEGVSFRKTPARNAVLDLVEAGHEETMAGLAREAGVSPGVVGGLVKLGRLHVEQRSVDAPFPAFNPAQPPQLNTEQQEAATKLVNAVREAQYLPWLLDGVTGSGKTEVYFEAIAAALEDPTAQILVLLPEIGLTRQWLKRFEARFGVGPAEWHSDVGLAERRRVWRAALTGNARIVVGARSALFLPFTNLSLIIVDEEHDPSYKQEDGVAYHARDMAVVRAQRSGVPIVLASATPSLESHINADVGRYERLILRERYGNAALPDIRAVDMRKAGLKADEWLSPLLVSALDQRLERREQSLLFLNRRGYAPLTLCRTCGHRFGCVQCSAWLVEHRFRKKLLCHQCGYEEPVPDTCPSCGAEDSLVACGPGVERLFEEVIDRFPDARVAVLTSDTPGGPKHAKAILEAISDNAVDIIIGTQLITKGYHFPRLTFVGVIDADLGLNGGDLRAAERTYQQLEQVAGRAGRESLKGEVLVQTHDPDHPVMQALVKGDRDAFMAAQKSDREHTGMPPYGRLAGIILSGEEESDVILAARTLASMAPAGPQFIVFGPAPAPISRLRGLYRMRLLAKADRGVAIQGPIRQWLSRYYDRLKQSTTPSPERTKMNRVRIKVDIDPYSFL